ncbi:MAG TPA: hypothetical protein VMS74_04975 [Acidimicrobiia bacterium]|nr:hypothetical protein [Acidimicrobiia bacterium]
MSDRSRPSGGRNPKRRPSGDGGRRPPSPGSGRRGPGGRPPRPDADRPPAGRSAKKEITAGTGQLPRWIRDEILHSTPKDRRDAAIHELEAGLTAFADERFGKAAGALRRAKELAPRAATVREILGLSAYNIEQWEEALRELRTYRRLTGTTDHMAVEMDCQRALGKVDGVDKTWELFNELGGSREAEDEIRVVYASSLLERGLKERAWEVIKPGRLVATPSDSLLRRWAVAARVAATNQDRETARKLVLAIRDADPTLAWLSQYDDLLS